MVSLPPNVWWTFFQKRLFMGDQLFRQIYGRLFDMGGLMIRLCQVEFCRFSFQLSELNFTQPWRDIHLKINPWPLYRIMERFILWLIVKRFQRLCSFQFPSCWSWPGALICWKVNTVNRWLNFKNTFCKLCLLERGFRAKPVFFFNIFSGNLHFDTLIIG